MQSFIGLAVSLLIPAAYVIHKYAGYAGLALLLPVALLFLYVCFNRADKIAGRAAQLPKPAFMAIEIAVFTLLLALLLVVYPIADSPAPGRGSDTDNALEIATTELLNFRFPYYQKTYLGNPLTPMPGSLILAAPWVLAWRGALQGFVWLLLFYLALRQFIFRPAEALCLFAAALIFSPLILHQYVVGIDYCSNSLYLFTPLLLYLVLPQNAAWGKWLRRLCLAIAGLGLSSRANFVFILPVFFAAVALNSGRRTATGAVLLLLVIAAAVTCPFYFYDPAGFSPLHTSGKLDQFNEVLPYAGKVIPLLTLLAALTSAWLLMRRGFSTRLFAAAFAFVLAVPVFLGLLLQSLQLGIIEPFFCSYGTFFVFPGLVAFSPYEPLELTSQN